MRTIDFGTIVCDESVGHSHGTRSFEIMRIRPGRGGPWARLTNPPDRL